MEVNVLSLTDRRAVQVAWIGWAVLFLVTAGIIIFGGHRTVFPCYRSAALNWLAGRNLYDGTGVGGFVYLPQAAVLFVPFAVLPQILGEVLWRLINLGTFAMGIRRFAGIADEQSNIELFPLMTLVITPFAWDCARNSQATLMITGLMLLAVVDLSRRRWWMATLWLSLGVAVKPLTIVLALLVAAIDRRMTWRVLAGMAATALLPFFIQNSAYVIEQYSSFFSNTNQAVHVGMVDRRWTSLFTALRPAGIDVPERVQMMLRIVAAFGTLLLCIIVRRRQSAERTSVFLFSLAAAYLMLFSPRTENNTYAMLGPVVAVFISRSFLVYKKFSEAILLSSIPVIMAGERLFVRLLTPQAKAIWLSPLVATCFSAYLIAQLLANPVKQVSEKNFATGHQNVTG